MPEQHHVFTTRATKTDGIHGKAAIGCRGSFQIFFAQTTQRRDRNVKPHGSRHRNKTKFLFGLMSLLAVSSLALIACGTSRSSNQLGQPTSTIASPPLSQFTLTTSPNSPTPDSTVTPFPSPTREFTPTLEAPEYTREFFADFDYATGWGDPISYAQFQEYANTPPNIQVDINSVEPITLLSEGQGGPNAIAINGILEENFFINRLMLVNVDPANPNIPPLQVMNVWAIVERDGQNVLQPFNFCFWDENGFQFTIYQEIRNIGLEEGVHFHIVITETIQDDAHQFIAGDHPLRNELKKGNVDPDIDSVFLWVKSITNFFRTR